MHIEVAPRRRHALGLTPLIDVVFNLLLFFMLASSLVDWRILDLATGSSPAAADAPPAAEVSVTSEARLRYNGETFDIQTLADRLAKELEEDAISSVILRAEEGVRLGPVVDAFDALAYSGIDALALGESGREQGSGREGNARAQKNSGTTD